MMQYHLSDTERREGRDYRRGPSWPHSQNERSSSPPNSAQLIGSEATFSETVLVQDKNVFFPGFLGDAEGGRKSLLKM